MAGIPGAGESHRRQTDMRTAFVRRAFVQPPFQSGPWYSWRMSPKLRSRFCLRVVIVIAAAILLALPAMTTAVEAADLIGPARVRVDASLMIHGRTVRLAGIYVPRTTRFCQTFLSPARCNSRAALALDFHIGTRMVRCDVVGRSADGRLAGICWINGRYLGERVDLGAWLISRGWALALPDAPFEYVALERIARSQGRGVLGLHRRRNRLADPLALRRGTRSRRPFDGESLVYSSCFSNGYFESTSTPVSVIRTCSSSFTPSRPPSLPVKLSTQSVMPASRTPS